MAALPMLAQLNTIVTVSSSEDIMGIKPAMHDDANWGELYPAQNCDDDEEDPACDYTPCIHSMENRRACILK